MLATLRTRHREPERMDDPHLDPALHRQALAGLARLNRFSGGAAAVWPSLRGLASELRRPICVLDVATGSGDLPAALSVRANRAKLPMHFEGCDISSTAVEAARGTGGNFFQHDVLREPLPTGYDAIICSLFMHHLDDAEAIHLLKAMAKAAGQLVIVNDLSRSRFNYAAVWAACRLLTRSTVAHHDGPVSVRAAFTVGEAQSLAERAGLSGATVRTRFPARFLLTWRKPA